MKRAHCQHLKQITNKTYALSTLPLVLTCTVIHSHKNITTPTVILLSQSHQTIAFTPSNTCVKRAPPPSFKLVFNLYNHLVDCGNSTAV